MQRPSIPLFIIPVALPAAYLLYRTWKITSCTTVTTGRQGAGRTPPPPRPIALPADVCADDGSQWVVTYECVVSRPVSTSELHVAVDSVHPSNAEKQPSPLLQAFSRATHLAFCSTLQAWLMRNAIGDPEAKRTFDASWIQKLPFKHGDVVNGAYKVVYHGSGPAQGSERIEFAIEAPASYRGPPAPRGLILTELLHIEPESGLTGEGYVVFLNETWMWRRHDEKPTLIESGLAALIHRLMAGWMVMRGVDSVTVA